jgi:hypothetical protein
MLSSKQLQFHTYGVVYMHSGASHVFGASVELVLAPAAPVIYHYRSPRRFHLIYLLMINNLSSDYLHVSRVSCP